jgi:hypothetical protein
MKRLLFICFILICLLGCRKDESTPEKFCWECMFSNPDGGDGSTKIQCNMSEEEIRKYEADNTVYKNNQPYIRVDCFKK